MVIWQKVLANLLDKAGIFNNIPARLIDEPTDVASATASLAWDEARYITGAGLFIDGGLLL